MTPDDIIAVIERGMCHVRECPTCATKRRAIAEVRTGREQLLAALAGIAERDKEIAALRTDVERLTSHGTRLLFRLADLRARDERIARVIGAARELHDAMCVGTCDDRDAARYRLHGALAALDDVTDAAETEAAHDLGASCGASVEGRAAESERKPVCTRCNDTHCVPVPEERAARGDTGPFGDGTWMCTSCPTPCRECACAGGRGAYCATTPCPCECHRERSQRHRARAQQRIGACLSMPPELAAAELRAISEAERADEEGER